MRFPLPIRPQPFSPLPTQLAVWAGTHYPLSTSDSVWVMSCKERPRLSQDPMVLGALWTMWCNLAPNLLHVSHLPHMRSP